jgi:mRNA-degrading endonuclease YafQ of YafQ-DinJ toxin-antitoxin module
MRELKITSQFKKDLKKYQNQPKRIEKLKTVLGYLQQDIAIPQEYNHINLWANIKTVWSAI